MRSTPRKTKTLIPATAGPITPGSPLYRALQMVAGEIADRLHAAASTQGTGMATGITVLEPPDRERLGKTDVP